MRITLNEKPTDPPHPLMQGEGATAKAFNKIQEELYKKGVVKFDFEQVATVLLEVFAEDYDKRHASAKKVKK